MYIPIKALRGILRSFHAHATEFPQHRP